MSMWCMIVLLSLSSLLFGKDEAELLWVGDAMQHKAQLESARKMRGDSIVYDYTGYFDAIKPYIESADYAVVNLETPLGGAPYSGYPMFCAPDAYAEALIDAGFDMMLCANNHVLDRRDRGLHRTIDRLDSYGVPHVGIYHNRKHREESSPYIIEVNGFRIAVLNYTYGTNGIEVQGEAIVNYIDWPTIERDIRKSRVDGAELVAVAVHWGDEYRLLPNAQQKQLAEKLKKAGVDMIIGGHPHVIQPIELTTDSVSGRRQLLVYSLGNFISAMRTADTRGGAMVRVRLERDSLGRAIIGDASYRTVFTVTPNTGSGENFRLVPSEQPLTGDMEKFREEFVRNAYGIYEKNNIGVAHDTADMKSYEKKLKNFRLQLLPIQK